MKTIGAFLLTTTIVFGQTALDRTNAKNDYQEEYFAMLSAESGTSSQCLDDIDLFEDHEDTEPAGQAAYDATTRKSNAAGYKATATALRATAEALCNQSFADPASSGLSFGGSLNPNEAIIDAAFRHYAAGNNACIPIFTYMKVLCEVAKLDIMTESVKETQNKHDELGEYNTWISNQGGGSGY